MVIVWAGSAVFAGLDDTLASFDPTESVTGAGEDIGWVFEATGTACEISFWFVTE